MQTQALILRTESVGENDRLITALTEAHGLLRAYANGAKKPRSSLHGATQSFAYGSYEFARRKDTYIVTDAQARGVFFHGLAADLSRLSLAGYFSAVCEELAPCEEPAPEQLRLTLNTLHFLSSGLRPQLLLKAALELRLLCLAGYQPDLNGLGNYLDCHLGRLVMEPAPGRVLVSPPVCAAMRHICSSALERVFRFALPEKHLRALSAATQEFLMHQTGKRFPELIFFEQNAL
jgi:DNA repair protein RecO (recombination protein O)